MGPVAPLSARKTVGEPPSVVAGGAPRASHWWPASGTVGGSTEPLVPGADELAAFSGAIVNVRWATTAVSLVLVGRGFLRPSWTLVAASLVVVGITIYRTRRPLIYTGASSSEALLLVELALFWLTVTATGFWRSPFVIAMAGVLVVAGFAGGFGLAFRVGSLVGVGVTAASAVADADGLAEWSSERLAPSIQWATILLLSGLVAGYARRISGEATERHSAALDRVSQLADANALLFNLHRLAQTLPASLDQTEVLESSLVKLRGLLDFDRALFLLVEDTDRTWTVARHQAMSAPTGTDGTVDPTRFPPAARQAISTGGVIRADDLDGPSPSADRPGGRVRAGFHPRSQSGLYAPLQARDHLIGLIAIESDQPARYDDRDSQTMRALVKPVALAIDNARWFGRLRRASVDEERSRIARELHDQIGQSLACLGFDADRLLRRHQQGHDIGPELGQLREGMRAATAEIRDALYDLRADVAEDKDLRQILVEFTTRVTERSRVAITVDCEAERRLPLLQEREMWRIAQEAVVNAERHADASSITVRWRCDDRGAVLEVVDDGRGMAADQRGRADSFGIIGMRERADSIGAAFEIVSKPGEGTRVQCYLNQT